MDIGKIEPREITEEMRESYLDYAMSVIVSRALPDVRDGLKPVHRRILYTMYGLGLDHVAKFRKSAAVVGDCLGKYHPHGDAAVYDTLARMAQDFSLRYKLIDGQGNFGSIDGDAAAAQRYTEARMSKISEEMLKDIDKETIDWFDNYDGTRKEPSVLPSKIPQLVLNGTLGIAVGMATNIPPHNLREVSDAAIYLIDHPSATTQDLFTFIKGPDFPTGGEIFDKKEIIEAYSQGKGSFIIRGKAEIVENHKSKYAPWQIIISEIPYQVNKSVLIEKMAELVHARKVEGVRDIRDESDKDGLRIAVDLRRDSQPQKILNTFYKFTDLQKTFHINMLALVGGIQPRVLSLKDVLAEWISHRYIVISRRSQFDLERAKERAHILEGLKKALLRIDAVIKTIKASPTKEVARERLIKKFKFSELQAQAILEMRLQTLAGLEREKINEELKDKTKAIYELTLLLKSRKKIRDLAKKEIQDIKDTYGDDRRTHVFTGRIGEISEEDLVPQEETILTVTRSGYIKRTSPALYKIQRRGGKGIIGLSTKGDDLVSHFLIALTHDNLLFFTNRGRVFKIPVYEIPEGSRISRGRALANFLDLGPEEYTTALIPLKKEDGHRYLVMVTAKGIIKKVEREKFDVVRRSGLIAIHLSGGDYLGWVGTSSGKDDIILVSRDGQSIRFKEKDVRPMGRQAVGIKGMRLSKDDCIVGVDIIASNKRQEEKGKRQNVNEKPPNGKVSTANTKPLLLVVTENGFGKRTDLKHFKVQRRGGRGVKAAKVTEKTGRIVSGKVLNFQEELIVISGRGHVIRVDLAQIPLLRRATQGVKIMRLEDNDKVVSITCL